MRTETEESGHTFGRGRAIGRLRPLFGLLAGGLAYSVIPRGAVGPHDIAFRAAITGATAGVTSAWLFVVSRRRTAVHRAPGGSSDVRD